MKTINPKMRSIKPRGTTAALGTEWVAGVEQGAASRPGIGYQEFAPLMLELG